MSETETLGARDEARPTNASSSPPATPAANMAGQAPLTMGQSSPAPTEKRRPGLVTFAAIMMFVSAGFTIVWALQELAFASWIRTNLASSGYGDMARYLWIWAILDLIVAAITIYAAIDVLRGGAFGLYIGLIMAGASAIRWFFYLPAAPWAALVIIGIDVLVIYGLVTGSDYFERFQVR